MNGEIEHYWKERKDDSTDNGGRHFDGSERTHPGCYAGAKQVSKITYGIVYTVQVVYSRPDTLHFYEYALPLCLDIEIF